MQSKGQFYRAFALQGRAPMIGVGVSKKAMPGYKGPADLKGKKIGVTAPGSSTNMVVKLLPGQARPEGLRRVHHRRGRRRGRGDRAA